jgi:hypothetical protein
MQIILWKHTHGEAEFYSIYVGGILHGLEVYLAEISSRQSDIVQMSDLFPYKRLKNNGAFLYGNSHSKSIIKRVSLKIGVFSHFY